MTMLEELLIKDGLPAWLEKAKEKDSETLDEATRRAFSLLSMPVMAIALMSMSEDARRSMILDCVKTCYDGLRCTVT